MTIVIKIAKLSLESKSCKFWVYECKLIIGIKHTLIYSLELFIYEQWNWKTNVKIFYHKLIFLAIIFLQDFICTLSKPFNKNH